jgi:hypothetical protein
MPVMQPRILEAGLRDQLLRLSPRIIAGGLTFEKNTHRLGISLIFPAKRLK